MKALLTLENNITFKTDVFGYEKSCAGEVVFNTGMVGYPESLTDPSYTGQILTFTYPLIGNYKAPNFDKDEYGLAKFCESSMIHPTAIIVSEHCQNPSHWKNTEKLNNWLFDNKIPGLYGIDTRKLTKILREHGTMLGKIEIDEKLDFVDPNKENLVANVSRKDVLKIGKGSKKIIVIDCGIKNNIIRNLLKLDFNLKIVPWDYDFTNEDYDGLFISNGPGDPKMCEKTILHLKKAMEIKKPIFGICLGHQLLALASSAETYKLKYGHRSHNQPCALKNGKGYITSQNHGFAVASNTIPNDWEEYFYNANDNTNEGIKHKKLPFFSVQFHPEACAGPMDTEWLFNEFETSIKNINY
ncbi:MAG: glutamine-hydrolyzing carbamoyl-phosphate synthase small subunit [Pseudomonadota bacterium]